MTLPEALAGIKTHNGKPLSPVNLRWAATHEALCRSFIFDVLTALADTLEADTFLCDSCGERRNDLSDCPHTVRCETCATTCPGCDQDRADDKETGA